jgi:serine/threonine protein kinase
LSFDRIKRLGSGVFGTVYLERDNELDRLCATKVLRSSQVTGRVNEAVLMRVAEHRHVAQVYQVDRDDEHVYIRMEFLQGGSVQQRFAGGPLPVLAAIDILADSLRGLQHLHSLGIVHGDIKPANLLLDKRNRVKLSDFGLAGLEGDEQSPTVAYLPHISPEQARASDFRGTQPADIYALGATAYRLLNGDQVFLESLRGFDDPALAIARGRFPDRNRWLPHVHSALRSTVRKALSPQERSRFKSATAMRLALEKNRPAVSWIPVVLDGAMHWEGSRGPRLEWSTSIETAPRGTYIFDVQRRAANGWRRQHKDRLRGTVGEVFQHAEMVLERIATTGR